MTRQQRAAEWAENAYFKLVSRVSIVAASTIGLPLATFILAQLYGDYMKMQDTQGEIVTTVRLVQQAAESQVRENDRRFMRIEQDVSEVKENQRRFLFRARDQ